MYLESEKFGRITTVVISFEVYDGYGCESVLAVFLFCMNPQNCSYPVTVIVYIASIFCVYFCEHVFKPCAHLPLTDDDCIFYLFILFCCTVLTLTLNFYFSDTLCAFPAVNLYLFLRCFPSLLIRQLYHQCTKTNGMHIISRYL